MRPQRSVPRRSHSAKPLRASPAPTRAPASQKFTSFSATKQNASILANCHAVGSARIEDEEQQARKEIDQLRRLPDLHVAALLSDFVQSGSATDFTPFFPFSVQERQEREDLTEEMQRQYVPNMMERIRQHRKQAKEEDPAYYKLMYPSGSDGEHSDQATVVINSMFRCKLLADQNQHQAPLSLSLGLLPTEQLPLSVQIQPQILHGLSLSQSAVPIHFSSS